MTKRSLPQMLEALRREGYDLVVGSRYVAGGGVGDWAAHRQRASSLATRLARLVTKTDIADPMSGFFMLRRMVFERVMRGLSTQGFKILLDLLATVDRRRCASRRCPFQFRQRRHGESKLDTLVAWEFAHAARRQARRPCRAGALLALRPDRRARRRRPSGRARRGAEALRLDLRRRADHRRRSSR